MPKKASEEAARIDLSNTANVERWCRVLCLEESVLRAVVKAAGPDVTDVMRYLDSKSIADY